MRIVHHSKTLGYAGTDRTAQLFVKYLNRIPGVEAFLAYRKDDDISRLEECKQTIGEQFLVPYEHQHDRGAYSPYYPARDNLTEVLASLKPDIFHIHRSGYPEWPGMKTLCPRAKLVETNIFGGVDPSPDIDKHIYISQFIAVRAKMLGNSDGPILMNPTEPPVYIDRVAAHIILARNLGLTEKAIFMGRVGRPDNFDPIALKAFARIKDDYPNLYYLVVNGCDAWRNTADELGLQDRVIFLPKIISDQELSRFYAGIDIYAHARVDGECQPCNLNEAMYHGVPIVSHVADTYQGHVDQILDSRAGFIAPHRDDACYADNLRVLLTREEVCEAMSERGKAWAKDNVDAQKITGDLLDIYKDVLHAN